MVRFIGFLLEISGWKRSFEQGQLVAALGKGTIGKAIGKLAYQMDAQAADRPLFQRQG
jgi:hypothetical protein